MKSGEEGNEDNELNYKGPMFERLVPHLVDLFEKD